MHASHVKQYPEIVSVSNQVLTDKLPPNNPTSLKMYFADFIEQKVFFNKEIN